MSDIQSAIGAAYDSEISQSEPVSTSDPAPAAEPVKETAAPEPTAVAAPAAEAPKEEETGDVLLDKLTPEELTAVKQDPRLRKIYAGLMKSYTPKMQALAEQQKLWDALNNPETKRQAVEALARASGVEILPSDQPQRDKAAQVADDISEEWSKVVGPEAAAMLRPLIEKTALASVQSTIKPLQQGVEQAQMDARARQAEAQVSQFRSLAKEKGWVLDAQVEAKMAEIGQQVLPAKPITSVDEGIQHLERLYRIAAADRMESDIEKRVHERMAKAAQTAEPARPVPSTGREKRSNITKEMSLQEAFDVAIDEVKAERNL